MKTFWPQFGLRPGAKKGLFFGSYLLRSTLGFLTVVVFTAPLATARGIIVESRYRLVMSRDSELCRLLVSIYNRELTKVLGQSSLMTSHSYDNDGKDLPILITAYQLGDSFYSKLYVLHDRVYSLSKMELERSLLLSGGVADTSLVAEDITLSGQFNGRFRPPGFPAIDAESIAIFEWKYNFVIADESTDLLLGPEATSTIDVYRMTRVRSHFGAYRSRPLIQSSDAAIATPAA